MRAAFAIPCFLMLLSEARTQTVDFRRDVVPILRQRCFECHQGKDATSGIRLDLRSEVLGESNGRPLVEPRMADKSVLILAVTGQLAGNKRMPKTGPPLQAEEIRVLRSWIEQGAIWDEQLFPEEIAHRDHWAFQPVKTPAIPKARADRIQHPIDAFLDVQRRSLGVEPAPPADRRTGIQRLTLDLTGLPALPSEVRAFEADERPDAYERLVERLLASPHYGERQARYWLDLARWAESEGYESNHLRPFAWRYRDWVVQAFNADKPFAEFVLEQIAGDQLTPYRDANLIATGFLSAARLSSNEEDRPRQRNDMHVDIVNATANVFLGLTFQCAQCHNHKYDPITARDYYRFLGYFVQGTPGNFRLRDDELWRRYNERKAPGYDDAVAERDRLLEVGRLRKTEEVRKILTVEQKRVLTIPMERRNQAEEKLARETDLLFQFSSGQIERALTSAETKQFSDLRKRITEMEKTMLDVPQTWAYVAPNASPHRFDWLPMKGFYPLTFSPGELARAKSYLLASGDVHQPKQAVGAGWPAVFGVTRSTNESSRLALADWLADPKHPLTARVYVNRIWQQHFGTGIVATASDFGVRGAAPTHPKLLDWLASEFLRSGGSTKHLHRLIVTSATYRQAARASRESLTRDPDNIAWSRWPIRRLEAEAVRDRLLAVTGELERTLGGASADSAEKSNRRSLYVLQKRDTPSYFQQLFDGPSAMAESCSRRMVTTVPLQPLYLMNSEFAQRRAETLTRRVRELAGESRDRQVAFAFELALGRSPSDAERSSIREFFEVVNAENDEVALRLFCQSVLNLNEFFYIE